MPESLGTAVLELRTDDAAYTRGISKARRDAQKLGKTFTSTGKTLSTRLTLPIVGLGVAMLKAAGDFEAGMNKVKALSGATEKQLKSLSDQAKELGATTQFSAGQAAEAMGFLSMAGFDATQIFKAMPATLNLAAAANIDLGQTADIVTNVMAGYGLQAKDTARLSDILTKTFTGSNTSLIELGEAMSYAGPVAKGFGLEIEEAAAVLGIFAGAGFKGSRGGTALAGALVRLATPSDEAAGIMKKLGLVVFDSTGKMKPFNEIIQQLAKSGTSAADMMTLFGQRAGPAMLALKNVGSKAVVDFTKKIRESGGVTEKIAKIQMKGLNGALKALKSSLEAVAIAVSESGLLEWVTKMATATAEWFRKGAKLDQELLGWGVIIAGVAAALGPLLIILGMVVTAIGVLLSPIGLVVIAVIALGAAFLVFQDEIIAVWDSVAGSIGAFVTAFIKLHTDVLGLVEELVTGIQHWMGDVLGGIWDSVVAGIERVKTVFTDLWKHVVGESVIPDMVMGVKVEMEDMKETMITTSKQGAEGVKISAEQAAQSLSGFFGGFAALAKSMGPKHFKQFKALAILEATANTVVGFTKAIATYPPPFGAIAAAGVLAAGMAKVRTIKAMEPPEFHSGGMVARESLLPFPGANFGEGLAVLREGEQVLTADQQGGRNVTIQLGGDEDSFYSRNNVRKLLSALEDEMADTAGTFNLQVM